MVQSARDNVLNFDFEFLLRAEFEISPKDIAEENGIHIPKIFVSIFRVHLKLAH